MTSKKQGPPLAVRFNDKDLAALNKAAAVTGRTRNSLVVEGARLFALMALSASNGVSADNAALHPVLNESNASAAGDRGIQGPEGEEGKLAPAKINGHAPRVHSS